MSLTLSVVIPVYNSARYLGACLTHLFQSTYTAFDCIVVDDGSTDDSAEVASSFGVTLRSTGGRRGPAYARNLGSESSRSDLLLFIDADVCVHPDTLQRVMDNFQNDSALDAVMGSYDHHPEDQAFLSQYRNLMHAFVHQTARREASTFWSGCGAVRRSLFVEHGGFCVDYDQPAIEDIELGYRLKSAGRKLLLDRTVQVKHLKKWTLLNMIKTDVFQRGIPWTELILRDKRMPDDLNLQHSQRLSVALVFLMVAMAILGIFVHGAHVLVPLAAILIAVLGTYYADTAVRRPSGKFLPWIAVVTGAVIYAFWKYYLISLLAPVAVGLLLLTLRHRFAYDSQVWRQITGGLYGFYLMCVVILMMSQLPVGLFVFGFVSLLAIVLVLNLRFYLFLAEKWGKLFALAAIPFHLFYFFYSGISFLAGICKHLQSRWRKELKERSVGV